MYFAVRMSLPNYYLPRKDYIDKHIYKTKDNEAIQLHFSRTNIMIFFNSFLLVTTAIKLLVFMSVIEKFSLLSNMLIECIYVIAVFLIFMVIWMMTFTFLYSIVGIEFGGQAKDTPNSPDDISKIMNYVYR